MFITKWVRVHTSWPRCHKQLIRLPWHRWLGFHIKRLGFDKGLSLHNNWLGFGTHKTSFNFDIAMHCINAHTGGMIRWEVSIPTYIHNTHCCPSGLTHQNCLSVLLFWFDSWQLHPEKQSQRQQDKTCCKTSCWRNYLSIFEPCQKDDDDKATQGVWGWP